MLTLLWTALAVCGALFSVPLALLAYYFAAGWHRRPTTPLRVGDDVHVVVVGAGLG